MLKQLSSSHGLAVAVASAIALVSAIVFGVTLAALGAPKGLTKDLAAVTAEADQAAGLTRRVRSRSGLERGQVCARAPSEEAQALQASLAQQMSQLRLTPASLEVQPQGNGEGARIAPVLMRFEATGAYGDVVSLLDAMAGAQPRIYADAVDLTAGAATVTLTFSGRVFCGV